MGEERRERERRGREGKAKARYQGLPEDDERGEGEGAQVPSFPQRTVLGGPGLGEQKFDELGIKFKVLFGLAKLRAVDGHLCLRMSQPGRSQHWGEALNGSILSCQQ